MADVIANAVSMLNDAYATVSMVMILTGIMLFATSYTERW